MSTTFLEIIGFEESSGRSGSFVIWPRSTVRRAILDHRDHTIVATGSLLVGTECRWQFQGGREHHVEVIDISLPRMDDQDERGTILLIGLTFLFARRDFLVKQIQAMFRANAP